MAYDLIIRGGRVVDGSGLPSYVADVGVKNGKIAEVGRLTESAARTIDAAGLAVSPGFIDHHTHLDAQMLWDPYGTCEPQHGITTVVMGNCGLTLAPIKKGDEDAVVKSFVRVEAIPRHALEQGVTWNWHSYGEYLDNFQGKVGINVGGKNKVSMERLREIEPHVGGLAALRVPQEGIVDYAKVCEALQREIEAKGGSVVLRAKVTALQLRNGGWQIASTAGDLPADFLINCAGLHCDRLSMLAGEKREVRIVPFRGEYYMIRPERQDIVRGLIYPVPDPEFPFLGVHLTRTVHGEVEAGPGAGEEDPRAGPRRERPDRARPAAAEGMWYTVSWPRDSSPPGWRSRSARSAWRRWRARRSRASRRRVQRSSSASSATP